jgi:hypothetical protein
MTQIISTLRINGRDSSMKSKEGVPDRISEMDFQKILEWGMRLSLKGETRWHKPERMRVID